VSLPAEGFGKWTFAAAHGDDGPFTSVDVVPADDHRT
jgi:hypothetical protein